MSYILDLVLVVFNGSKILIWKQITTNRLLIGYGCSCFQWFKDTNLKANHNFNSLSSSSSNVVFNGSKILIWKQITTPMAYNQEEKSCFQWFKDTNLKANHNRYTEATFSFGVVFNGSKILIWKQITTYLMNVEIDDELFSMVQRY